MHWAEKAWPTDSDSGRKVRKLGHCWSSGIALDTDHRFATGIDLALGHQRKEAPMKKINLTKKATVAASAVTAL